jgi:hypothetical protein
MEVILTDDVVKALIAEARERGITPEQLAIESLRREFVRSIDDEKIAEGSETLADYLSEFIGTIHSSEHVPGGARLSEITEEALMQTLAEKRRQGHL